MHVCGIIRSARAGIRPHPRCHDPGLHAKLTFDPGDEIAAPFISQRVRPRVAILREQGVNGQMEMAAAFDRAGFTAIDVHIERHHLGLHDA